MSVFPQPKPALLDPLLVRPSWNSDSGRDPQLLWLDKNENTDPELIDLLVSISQKISKTSLYTYPNLFPLYKKIASYAKVSVDNLVVTPGSDGVIRAVFETFVSVGDVVLHTSPTFAMYPVYCKIFGAKAHAIHYSKSDKGPQLQVEVILKHLRDLKPKLLCLPNPDSPTGTVLSPEDLQLVIHEASLQNTLVLIDEAYFEFYQHTACHLISHYKNLVIARTFAKGWGLAGLRVGYAIACPEITHYLHKIRPMYEVNTFAVHFLEKMLDHEGAMQKSVARLLAGKQHFKESMSTLGFRTLDNYGNFQHVSFGDKEKIIHAKLANLVLYRLGFSEECLSGFSRFSITTKEIFSKVISAIEGCVS